jgi:hypothetical protein
MNSLGTVLNEFLLVSSFVTVLGRAKPSGDSSIYTKSDPIWKTRAEASQATAVV